MEIKEREDSEMIEQDIALLVPGMKLAADVCSADGKVLANNGSIVSRHTIEKFTAWQISKVFIAAETPVNPITDLNIRQFINEYNQSVTFIQKAFDDIRTTDQIPVASFECVAGGLVEKTSGCGNIIDQLYNLPRCDDYTYFHSVNVSIIASMIARWLKLPPHIMNAVSMAGLLHDVGKARLPADLLHQPHKLAAPAYEHYRQHVAYGYELARQSTQIAPSILDAILQHHEREDGSGYPYGLKTDKIHPYAKIVAVADLYDEALTLNHDPADTHFTPYSSLEKLRDRLHTLDPKACLVFIDNMLNCLSGNQVVLTDKRQGRVVFLNTEQPSRSMVQLNDQTVLDLSEDPDVRIQYVLR
ncbi:Hypothetical protein LUCI_3950 [Lucifera butyrica]|uniref:Uncharacterized protein n=1 Tax=Lucifera butyrica TaxID=1351585 RepID=A0A498REZ6_9FIRM|nr:HD domain-containing phosphohydrolase [Lucifera butyrica]VBB08672.1 Hypothetical protein LUCI_3950 [Lucifera butyrica]